MKKNIIINSKGQMLSYDLMAAAVIFLLVVSASISTLNSQKITKQEQDSLQQMHLIAANTFDTMLNDQNCSLGGMVNEKRVLSQTKLNCINALDYNTLKQNLGIEQYEFYLKIFDNNSITFQKGTTTNNRAVSIQRVAILDTNAKKGVFVLYEK